MIGKKRRMAKKAAHVVMFFTALLTLHAAAAFVRLLILR